MAHTLFDEIVNDERDFREYEQEQYFEEFNRSFDTRSEQDCISDLLRTDDAIEYILQ
jgi:hypothetical protein